jgi:hypothetical protein
MKSNGWRFALACVIGYATCEVKPAPGAIWRISKAPTKKAGIKAGIYAPY